MKENIYEDLLNTEPEDFESKEYKTWEKKLHKSIGWIDRRTKDSVFVHNGKIDSSTLGEERMTYDVCTKEGQWFTCENEEHAEILSLLSQINARLKRIEDTKK